MSLKNVVVVVMPYRFNIGLLSPYNLDELKHLRSCHSGEGLGDLFGPAPPSLV